MIKIGKMGRPTEEPKTKGYRLRMTDSELQKLEEYCGATGLSKADVIRMGLQMVYDSAKKE